MRKDAMRTATLLACLIAGCHGSRVGGGDVSPLDVLGQDLDEAKDADHRPGLDPGARDGDEDREADIPAMPEPFSDSGDESVQDQGPFETGPDDTGPWVADDPGSDEPGFDDPGGPVDLAGPDAPPPESPVFRVSDLEVTAPEFCLRIGGVCAVDTALVNAYLAAALADQDNPLNLLLRFVPFEVGSEETDLLFGSGPCLFIGTTPVACAFSTTEPPVTFEGPVFVPCGLEEQPVACFQTPEKKVEMWFMGVFLAMHRAQVSGWIETGVGGFRITHGHLYGYVPVKTTKSFQVVLPSGLAVTLYDLVQHNPVVDLDGVKAYFFEFRFQADPVGYLD